MENLLEAPLDPFQVQGSECIKDIYQMVVYNEMIKIKIGISVKEYITQASKASMLENFKLTVPEVQ